MSEQKKEWGIGVYDLLSWFRTDRVHDARVMVVGAGALGNEVLKNLALFGVGHVYVVDFDTIEYTNLTRSVLFREEDADKGLFKANVAAKRVKEINRNVDIHPIVGRLDSGVGLGLYRSVDVVLGCLDSQIARLQLNRLCIRAGVPWVDGGIDNLVGMARVFKKGVNCYECEMSESTKEQIFRRMSCSDVARRNTEHGRVPTTPVVASVIGAVQVQEAMKIIHEGYVDEGVFTSLCGRWFHYEGSHMATRVYRSAVWSDECVAHEDWEPLVSIVQLGADSTVSEALSMLSECLHSKNVEINLRNTRFVDKIVTRKDNKIFNVMCPEYMVPDAIDANPQLYTKLPSDINQNVYENINADFPYQNLSLKQLGIPYWDVIQVSTDNSQYFVELTADKNYYDSL